MNHQRQSGRQSPDQRLARALLILGCVVGMEVGCGRTSEGAKDPQDPKEKASQEFDAFVAVRGTCATDTECAIVWPGCPLGCGVGVRAEKAAEVEAKAQALIAELEKESGQCTYKCAGANPKCQAGQCIAVTD